MQHSLLCHGMLPFLLLVLILSTYTTTASRLVATPTPKQARDEVKVAGFSQVGHSGKMEGELDTWNLMGSEICDNGDVECLNRRRISEAHLDYIYTQHTNP